MASALNEHIAQLRSFNRFYTVETGLLADGFLKSPFSLTEGRVLYELAHREDATASDLKRDLGIDAGYLSRILKRFAARGLVERRAAKDDGRKALLRLTAAGHAAYAPLDRASNEDARAKLAPLSERDRKALAGAVRTVERLLRREPPVARDIILRPPRIGDIGWLTQRHGALYAEQHGWDITFEALVAEILAKLILNFDPEWERGWIAERDGEVVGCVFAERHSRQIAKLRLLLVEPHMRGQGLGRRLVDACVRFAREKGYAKMTLWTQSNLTSARRIYEAAGFKLVKEEKHNSFGKDLVGETWEIDLRRTRLPSDQNQRSLTHRPSRGRSSKVTRPSK